MHKMVLRKNQSISIQIQKNLIVEPIKIIKL
nr:MAG TPA: hypothetical protein [Caudoviricetes sp.]